MVSIINKGSLVNVTEKSSQTVDLFRYSILPVRRCRRDADRHRVDNTKRSCISVILIIRMNVYRAIQLLVDHRMLKDVE